jgi:hypothetical protein
MCSSLRGLLEPQAAKKNAAERKTSSVVVSAFDMVLPPLGSRRRIGGTAAAEGIWRRLSTVFPLARRRTGDFGGAPALAPHRQAGSERERSDPDADADSDRGIAEVEAAGLDLRDRRRCASGATLIHARMRWGGGDRHAGERDREQLPHPPFHLEPPSL